MIQAHPHRPWLSTICRHSAWRWSWAKKRARRSASSSVISGVTGCSAGSFSTSRNHRPICVRSLDVCSDALVRWPCRKCTLAGPDGTLPPCSLHRPLAIAGHRQRVPRRVLAPQAGAPLNGEINLFMGLRFSRRRRRPFRARQAIQSHPTMAGGRTESDMWSAPLGHMSLAASTGIAQRGPPRSGVLA